MDNATVRVDVIVNIVPARSRTAGKWRRWHNVAAISANHWSYVIFRTFCDLMSWMLRRRSWMRMWSERGCTWRTAETVAECGKNIQCFSVVDHDLQIKNGGCYDVVLYLAPNKLLLSLPVDVVLVVGYWKEFNTTYDTSSSRVGAWNKNCVYRR